MPKRSGTVFVSPVSVPKAQLNPERNTSVAPRELPNRGLAADVWGTVSFEYIVLAGLGALGLVGGLLLLSTSKERAPTTVACELVGHVASVSRTGCGPPKQNPVATGSSAQRIVLPYPTAHLRPQRANPKNSDSIATILHGDPDGRVAAALILHRLSPQSSVSELAQVLDPDGDGVAGTHADQGVFNSSGPRDVAYFVLLKAAAGQKLPDLMIAPEGENPSRMSEPGFEPSVREMLAAGKAIARWVREAWAEHWVRENVTPVLENADNPAEAFVLVHDLAEAHGLQLHFKRETADGTLTTLLQDLESGQILWEKSRFDGETREQRRTAVVEDVESLLAKVIVVRKLDAELVTQHFVDHWDDIQGTPL